MVRAAKRGSVRIGLVAALGMAACSTTTSVSVDPDANYGWVFAAMPEPRPEIVHSRVDRQDPIFLGFREPPRNGHWEFELIASPTWLDALNPDFTQIPWSMVCERPDVPAWFDPDATEFAVWHVRGSSGVPAAYVFREIAPRDSQRVRAFIRTQMTICPNAF